MDDVLCLDIKAYMVNPEDTKVLAQKIFDENWTINPQKLGFYEQFLSLMQTWLDKSFYDDTF